MGAGVCSERFMFEEQVVSNLAKFSSTGEITVVIPREATVQCVTTQFSNKLS
jgi:hypothetical protein